MRCRSSDTIAVVKVKVEVASGMKIETLALCLPSRETPLGDTETVSANGMPSELYALVLQKKDLASIAGVPHAQLMDCELAQTCSSPDAQGDIIVLNGCSQIRDMSCLAKLEQMQVLDVSGCSSMDGPTLATAIKGLK